MKPVQATRRVSLLRAGHQRLRFHSMRHLSLALSVFFLSTLPQSYYSRIVLFCIRRKLCSGCNKWTAPTERWTAVAREGRRCPRACHTQAVCEDPVENGRAAGEQHQISCCQVCVDARSAVTCAACCSLHLSSRAQCTSQPRTHHVRSQCRRFRPGCRRPDRAEADEATHRRGRPRWL